MYNYSIDLNLLRIVSMYGPKTTYEIQKEHFYITRKNIGPDMYRMMNLGLITQDQFYRWNITSKGEEYCRTHK